MSDKEREIVRAQGWEEIFPDPAEAQRQFQDLIRDMRDGFGEHLDRERIEVDPETGITTVVLDHHQAYSTRVQRLANSNLEVQFVSPGRTNVMEVKPDVGNREHGWDYIQIRDLQVGLRQLHDQCEDPVLRHRYALGMQVLRGKLATAEEEELTVRKGRLPQRIGYRIYADED